MKLKSVVSAFVACAAAVVLLAPTRAFGDVPLTGTTADYAAQDDLITYWDGVENSAVGRYSGTITEWKDLVGARAFALKNVTVGINGITFKGDQGSYGELSGTDTDAVFNGGDFATGNSIVGLTDEEYLGQIAYVKGLFAQHLPTTSFFTVDGNHDRNYPAGTVNEQSVPGHVWNDAQWRTMLKLFNSDVSQNAAVQVTMHRDLAHPTGNMGTALDQAASGYLNAGSRKGASTQQAQLNSNLGTHKGLGFVGSVAGHAHQTLVKPIDEDGCASLPASRWRSVTRVIARRRRAATASVSSQSTQTASCCMRRDLSTARLRTIRPSST